jgi:hypothetical protein
VRSSAKFIGGVEHYKCRECGEWIPWSVMGDVPTTYSRGAIAHLCPACYEVVRRRRLAKYEQTLENARVRSTEASRRRREEERRLREWRQAPPDIVDAEGECLTAASAAGEDDDSA